MSCPSSRISNSWGPPDAEAYVRMAFGQVAGQTVAVLTALALVGMSIRMKSRDLIIASAIISLFVIPAAFVGMQAAADTLIRVLG